MIHNPSICYNGINATMRAYADCILEKLDLRLPIRDIAMEKVQVRVPCLIPNFTNKLVPSPNIDITNHNDRAIGGPAPKESFPESRGTPCDDNGLISKPRLVWHSIGVNSW